MTKVTFYQRDNVLCGFEVMDHSGYAEEGQDIVCAAVSSAVYMSANTITDVQCLNADVTVDDGYIKLMLSSKEAEKAEVILSGLKLHLIALSEQYKKYIKVKISEV